MCCLMCEIIVVVLPLSTFLFLRVMNAEEALKVELGSAVLTLWVVFYCIAVIVSISGLYSCGTRFRASMDLSRVDHAGMGLKVLAFFNLKKRRAMEFAVHHGDECAASQAALLMTQLHNSGTGTPTSTRSASTRAPRTCTWCMQTSLPVYSRTSHSRSLEPVLIHDSQSMLAVSCAALQRTS